jgi:hypothetical protein
MKNDACAERNSIKRMGVTKDNPSRFIASLCFGVLLTFSFAGETGAATRAELQQQITALNNTVSVLDGRLNALSQSQAELIRTYKLTNATVGSLMVAGTVAGQPGATLTLPLSFVKGPMAVAGLQTEFVIPSSFTVTGITAGPAAVAANKSVQLAINGGVARIIIFGLNQDMIGSGVVANLTLRSLATTPRGTYKIPLRNSVSSDAAGGSLLIFETSGAVVL